MSLMRVVAAIIALGLILAIGVAVSRHDDLGPGETADQEAQRRRQAEHADPDRGGAGSAGSDPQSASHLNPSSERSAERPADRGGAAAAARDPANPLRSAPHRDEQAAADQRRRNLVNEMPEARDGDRPIDVDDEPLLAGLPRGIRFAAAFNSNPATIDGSEPIVEKNTNRDSGDGVYLPADGELAYANRAGVRGDSGTLALWVEPVDWEGKDASTHSFFRLNDPRDTGYRFHLVKDSANLRLQFITENGESNIRVPIDWWPRGERHHVAATWDSNVLRLYIDGVPLSEQAYSGTLAVPANVPGWWGSGLANGTPGAGAILGHTLVADRPLEEAEIQRLWENDG